MKLALPLFAVLLALAALSMEAAAAPTTTQPNPGAAPTTTQMPSGGGEIDIGGGQHSSEDGTVVLTNIIVVDNSRKVEAGLSRSCCIDLWITHWQFVEW